jgi:hypothetical protein
MGRDSIRIDPATERPQANHAADLQQLFAHQPANPELQRRSVRARCGPKE